MKWVVWVALAGCMSPVMRFGSGKSSKEAQHDTLNEQAPAQLSTEATWHGPITELSVRVYADDEYRAQNLNWQRTFDEELQGANAMLGPSFGVHLVAQYREWNHHAPGNSLPEDLAELQQLDAGADVLSVIGLTSSLALASGTFDLLGFASVPGRHIMLRGYADLEERKGFERAFHDLPTEERQSALAARRRHKTAAVILHELGHNLGAPHDPTEDTLMHATYSDHSSAFSPEAHAQIQRTLDQRLGRASSEAPSASTTPKHQRQLHLHLTADGVIIDGAVRDDGAINMAFGSQAAVDKDTEVVIEKDKGVPAAKLVELIDRAKAMGLTKFTLQ